MSDTLEISERYRVKREYVAALLRDRGVKPSARARAKALGISPPVAWRLFYKPKPGEPEFFAGPKAAKAICDAFPEEKQADLMESA